MPDDGSPFQIQVTDQAGVEHTLDALEGWRVMEVIRDHGLKIRAECGGACACATCHVYVDERWAERLVPPLPEEVDMLDGAFDVASNSRLSCQIILAREHHGIRVALAPGSD